MNEQTVDIHEYIEDNPDSVEPLKKILRHENSIDPDSLGEQLREKAPNDVYWGSSDVPVNGTKLYHMWTDGILKKVYDSSNYTDYALKVDREELSKAIKEHESMFEGDTKVIEHDPATDEELEDVFEFIVGYDDVKWLFKKALKNEDSVNIILYGPPGSGKTMFLRAIASLEGGHFINARSTEAGIADDMFEHKPRFLTIDELDDMDSKHQKSLSDFTEDGVIKETKGNSKSRSMEINTKTFASANKPEDVVNQIDDRFTDLHFEAYTLEEFMEICRRLLPKKYGTEPKHAADIAEAVWEIDNHANVRKAEDVANLSDGEDPKKVLGVLDNYSS